MKRALLFLAVLLASVSIAAAQESEFSGGGGTAGAITAGVGSGNAGRVPQFASATSVVDSKMLTSGTNSGTWTLYDSTGGSGSTSLVIRGGPAQGDDILATFRDEGLTKAIWLSLNGYGAAAHFSDDGSNIDLTVNSSVGINLSGDKVIGWCDYGPYLYGANTIGLAWGGTGILKVTDGSTGSGGIGISDAATATVTDALILRHATTATIGDVVPGFGTGLLFQAENDAGTMHTIGGIDAVWVDDADTTEDSVLKFYAMEAGAKVLVATMNANDGSLASRALSFNGVGGIEAGTTLTIESGAGANIRFGTSGIAQRWVINGTTGAFHPDASFDNTYDIGTSSARVADIFAGRLSVYDTTVTTGVSQVSIQAGAGQGATRELEVLDNAGTARFGFTNGSYTLFVGGTGRIRMFGDGSNALVFPAGGAIYVDSYDPLSLSNPTLMRGSTKTLTDGAATDFVTIPIGNNTAVAGIIEYTVVFSTGGNIEVESGEIHFGGTNEAGTELADVSELGTPLQVPTTTMTVDFAVTTGTDNMTISCDADSTALAVNPVITYRVRFNSGGGSYTVP